MSIKKNFLYSSLLTASNYVFPLITFPYISRTLGVEKIGICNFVDSVIDYFILFSMMGIAATGIREIAAAKSDSDKMDSAFSSLCLLNSIFTFVVLVILLLAIHMVPKLYEYQELLYVGAFKLVANLCLFEWLFKGIEDFKYITCRTLVIKSIYIISVFVFVQSSDDFFIYYLLTVLMVVGNAILNCLYASRFVHLTRNGISIKPFIKPCMTIGGYMILTSMYRSFNVAYLGFVCGPTEVGYYATSTKIFGIIIAVFSAFTGVMLPRMSALCAHGQMDEFKEMISKSVRLLVAFSIPLIVLSEISASDIIQLVAGSEFEKASIPMRIIIPLLFVIGYEQILVLQILMPMKKDKAIIINSILGAVTGIILNILLVNTLKATGSAIVWISSELVILISALLWTRKIVELEFPWKVLTRNVIAYLPCLIVITTIHKHIQYPEILRLSITTMGCILYAIIIQFCFLKEKLVMKIVKDIIR